LAVRKGKAVGYDIFFLESVAKKQNAKILIKLLNLNLEEHRKAFKSGHTSPSYDLGLVPLDFFISDSSYRRRTIKFVNTFEVSGYCALIPIPPRRSFLRYLFVPYDWMSWLFMALSLVALAIVWKIFKAQRDSRNLNSSSHMVFLVFAGFLGQSFDFRHTRWFHLMIVQLFMFAVVILGNAYQSLLISLLMTSRNDSRITTVNEMLARDYSYLSDGIFHNVLMDFNSNSSMAARSFPHPNIYDISIFSYQRSAANNSVIVMKCEYAQQFFYAKNFKFSFGHIADSYYILPEKLYSLYEKMSTTRFSPFTERFEELSMRIFESGIKQRWRTLLHKFAEEVDFEQMAIDNEQYLLKMDDLKFVFYIWAIAISPTVIAFVTELLCYKYRARIRKSWIGKVMKKITGRERRERREREEAKRWRRRRMRAAIENETFEMINCEV
jgi:hypothetical protein